MKDINLFKSQPLNTKVLLATAAIYAFVLPVIEIFQAAYIMGQSADMARVVFDKLQRAVTPGQAVVFYEKDSDIVIGGGTIREG